MRELKHTKAYSIYGYKQGGFAIISADDLAPELLGVSETDYTQSDNPGFNWWLKAIDEVITKAVKSNTPLNVIKPDPTKYKSEVPTMLTTVWGQQMPYNKIVAQYAKRTIAYRLCSNGNSTGS